MGTLERGKTLTLDIEGLATGGEGLARADGLVFFVPFGVPGDRVKAEITDLRKNYGRARIRDVLAASPHRVVPPCPVYGECGGCQWQHVSYSRQLAAKHQVVRDCLERIGGFGPDEVFVHEVAGSPDPWRYRYKAQFPVGTDGRKLVTGIYARGSHRLVPVDECLIQHPLGNRAARAVREAATGYRLTAYDEDRRRGLLRHVLIRVGGRGREAMVVLVTAERDLPRARELAREVMKAVPEITSVHQNVNPRATNVVLGDRTRLVAGQPAIRDYLGDLSFRLSPTSFFQVNPPQAEVLCQQVLEYAALTGRETVADVYCGVGTLTLHLARRAKAAFGAEALPRAVEDARENARENGIGNVTFLAGDAAKVLPQMASAGLRFQVVVLNPPRRGCQAEVLAAVVRVRPLRVIYVSCNPATLARDLAFLKQRGYRTTDVRPVDMFPHTHHVECVARAVNVTA